LLCDVGVPVGLRTRASDAMSCTALRSLSGQTLVRGRRAPPRSARSPRSIRIFPSEWTKEFLLWWPPVGYRELGVRSRKPAATLPPA